jgi:glycosyltransferase involved in cell wall biosynthesis
LGHLWEQLVLPLRVLPYRAWVWSPCNFGPVLCRRQVVSVYDVAPVDHPEWFSAAYGRWFRACVGRLHRRVRVVVVSTPFTRERIASAFGPTRATVAIVPGGVAPAIVAGPSPPTSAADEEQEGGEGAGAGPPDGPFVCFVGSLEPRKNLDVLLEAMAIVQRTLACPLVVVGPTASTRVFASGGAPAASPPWIHWAGRVDDATLEHLLRRSACLAYPSRYEGFGLPPLEAMAVGTLVVASDIPPLRQTCGDAARYVDPDDAESIAAGLVETVLMDEGARERRRGQGAARVQHFTWAAAAAALEEVVWPST